MSNLLESLLTTQQRTQAAAADAAMLNLNTLRAERAVLHTAAQAMNAALRPAFDADYGVPTDHPLDPRNGSMDDDSFTSLQPLGDASVMVVYTFTGNNDVSVDGIMIGGEFVDAENFSQFVRGMWRRAIEAEERKNAEIDREAAMAGSDE